MEDVKEGITIDMLEHNISKLIVEAPDQVIKDGLCKIRPDQEFDTIKKIIDPCKIKDVHHTLFYLMGRDPDTFKFPKEADKSKSEQVSLIIIKRFFNLMNHKCESCDIIIEMKRTQ